MVNFTSKKQPHAEGSSLSDLEDNQPVTKKPQNYRAPIPPTTKVKDGFEHWPKVLNV